MKTKTNPPRAVTFDEAELKAAIAGCPKIVRQYLEALKDALDKQVSLTAMAVKKLREKTAD